MNSRLSTLIYPHTDNEFMSFYERNEPFIVHNNDNLMKSISDLSFLNSLDSMLQSWPSTIQAHLPDLRDESSSISTSAQDAKKLHNNGMGLLFNEVQSISPFLSLWLENIRMDLGLSNLSYKRCLVYSTPNGKGTSPHFDQNINFVCQIKGTKVWHLAPNQHIQNPLTRHSMGTEPDSEMVGYLERNLPTKMPTDSQTVTLQPGSMLFVPRGYWHSTEATSDALALNFTFTATTWIDLFTTALRSRLSLSPEWRATANGVSDPKRLSMAEEELETLLYSIIEDLPNWNAQDIINATENKIDQ